jgi:hypothetical protein
MTLKNLRKGLLVTAFDAITYRAVVLAQELVNVVLLLLEHVEEHVRELGHRRRVVLLEGI